jgi:hypothetical protein
VVPPGFKPLVAPLPAPAVPPGFLPHAASTTPVAPHVVESSSAAPSGVAPESPTAPHAAAITHTATDGPAPRDWPSSPIIYAKRPRQPALTACMGPALTSLDRRPPTAIPMTPPMNPHRMVSRAKAGFQVLLDHLVLATSTSPSTSSPIPTFVCAALADPNWRAAMKAEYRPLMSNGT